jgi:hypothetical protein
MSPTRLPQPLPGSHIGVATVLALRGRSGTAVVVVQARETMVSTSSGDLKQAPLVFNH